MANETSMAKIDQFKGILNSQQIRAQVKNSLKENAGAFMSSILDLYSGDSGGGCKHAGRPAAPQHGGRCKPDHSPVKPHE